MLKLKILNYLTKIKRNYLQLLIKKLKDKSVFKLAETEYKFISDNKIAVHSFQDATYPEKLRHCIDSPALLFSSGKIDFNDQRIISIVGTREVTTYGTDFCKKLIEDLK